MLAELVVSDLGVSEHLALVLGPGMPAVTGETGAGKTLIVGALELLVGGRADPSMVRAGATEAVIEGRFVVGDDELILRRVVPREGRSRAYLDGGLATAATLGEVGGRFVDLHGQHDHQSLLVPSVQRGALDRFGGIDLEPWHAARKELARLDDLLAALGGDERERAREIDLLRFQVRELDDAALDDPNEDDQLEREEDLLADALAHQEAASLAADVLGGDSSASDAVARAIAALDGRAPFTDAVVRLRSVAAEVADLAADVRRIGEAIDDDQERLAVVRDRRRLLHDLRRKYGDSLADVVVFHREVRDRLDALEARDATAAALDLERSRAVAAVRGAEAQVGAARRAAAPALAAATETHLRKLAMPKAHLQVRVGDDPGEDVVFELAANPGSPPLPLARVASGGELARAMLALRLVLTEAPDTLVFDEVDAGVGGTAATAVGQALGALGRRHQVLVVTHLPQVAACADAQVVVTKTATRTRTTTAVTTVEGDDRVVEIARMLSGSPDSDSAREHAAELLTTAVTANRGARRRR